MSSARPPDEQERGDLIVGRLQSAVAPQFAGFHGDEAGELAQQFPAADAHGLGPGGLDDGDPALAGIVGQDRDERGDGGAGPLLRSALGFGECGQRALPDLVGDPLDDAHEQLVPAGETLVEVPFGEPGLLADRGHGGTVATVAAEHRQTGLEQLLAAVGGALLGALSAVLTTGPVHSRILTDHGL